MKLEEVQQREQAHFLPVAKRLPVALVEGRGSRVRDVEGCEYIDLTAGWGVNSIGHCHPTMVAMLHEQAQRLIQTTNFMYTLPQLDLVEALAKLTPPELTRTFLLSSGTEAMDGAIKLAHRGTGRTKFVSTSNSFHGRSIGALGVIGQQKFRDPYEAILRPNNVVPYDDLDAARAAVDADTAAFVVEPVQGEGGVNVPSDGYLRGLREICDAVGAYLILDEIQTGVGRTGRMFALEHEGVVPDILTIGKGLGGGMPIAGFMCSERVTETVQLGDHGGTYAGNVLACAGANAVLNVIREEKLVERSAKLGAELLTKLQAFADEHPDQVETVRGLGLLCGLVLRDPEHAVRVQQQGIENGVLVNVAAGRVLRFFPALNIPEDDLWDAVTKLLTFCA